MAKSIRIRATVTDGDNAEVRFLLRHPMESGFRKDKAGKKINAHYIQELKVEHKQRVLLDGKLGTSIAANPLFHLKFKGAAAGETIKISWKDSKGETRSDVATIS